MPKFSIIVPVYNVEEYIGDCLESIINQTEKDFEVIVVNDGTKDKSIEIAKKYPVKIVEEENKGLSAARNLGVKHAKGDYIIFIDSDDYIEKDLLKELSNAIKDKPDIVRYQIQEVYDDKRVVKHEEKGFETCNGEKAFSEICKYYCVESACCYCYRRKFFVSNKFLFKEGTYHEDFGLIPLVIMKAKSVKSIEYIGYNYRQREDSIMTSQNYSKVKKKVDDFLTHYIFLITEINKEKVNAQYFKSFISNSLILKITELNKEDYKKYKKILKQERVYDNLLTDTFARKIKKIIAMKSPKLMKNIIRKVK